MPASPTDYAQHVAGVRAELADHRVVVFDLDGVLRHFDPAVTDAALEPLGLPSGTWAEVAFDGPHVAETITGRRSFLEWSENIAAELVERTGCPTEVEAAIASWVAYRGEVIPQTRDLIEDWRAEGREIFLFTNGTDAIPRELRGLGLGHLLHRTINSAVLGHAKPDQAAYRSAHAVIEAALGTRIDPGQVGFVDDRIGNVESARTFGWIAMHFGAHA